MEGRPVPQGSMRAFNNHIVHNKSAELMAWRSLIAMEARKAGCQPIEGAIEIKLNFFYLRPKSVKRPLPIVAPDLDKQIRSVLDALTGVAYLDDGQVVGIQATKRYGDRAGVSVEVTDGFDAL